MKLRINVLVAFAVLGMALLPSCKKEQPTPKEVTPIMEKALNDSTSIWYADFKRFPQKDQRAYLPI
ncbi:MAG: hypothetical protein IKY05_04015, partial [Bacteroidales bacterium]|nr:hypothetical protein [Bacteroidales bacterium]